MYKIGILNLGVGNIMSVTNAFRNSESISTTISSPGDIIDYDLVVIPGVGSAGVVADKLVRNYKPYLEDHISKDKKIVGICLGYQLLFTGTTESGGHDGLGFINGICSKINEFEDISLRVGWFSSSTSNVLNKNSYFYYNHCYGVNFNSFLNKDEETKVDVLDNTICCIETKNIFGLQFHPEKSQTCGVNLIQNFLKAQVN